MGKKKKNKKKKKKFLLEEVNPVLSRWYGDPEILKPVLQYTQEFYRQGKFRKERMETIKYLISNKGTFLTGLLPRVIKQLKNEKVKFKLSTPDYNIDTKTPKVKGIKFRGDQLYAIQQMIKAKRGVWKAPTQSGKTIIMAGLISAIQTPALVVCYSKDVFDQNYETMTKCFGTSRYKIGRVGAGHKDPREITVCTIHSLIKLSKYGMKWGLVLVDEAKRCSKLKGMYAKALSELMSPYRYGFDATPPKEEEQEKRMAMEAYIGPIVGVTEYEELKETVLAKPVLKLLLVPPNKDLQRKPGKYVDIYTEGIVLNRARNQLIIEEALKYISDKKTVLIIVERIKHGEELMKIAKMASPKTFSFVHGNTTDIIRREEKILLTRKKRKGVVATRVWAEGSSIMSLDVVINAVGGESEKAAIQRFGRGLGKTKKKDKVILIDFIDAETHRWFEKHSIKRICYYSEWGWL